MKIRARRPREFGQALPRARAALENKTPAHPTSRAASPKPSVRSAGSDVLGDGSKRTAVPTAAGVTLPSLELQSPAHGPFFERVYRSSAEDFQRRLRKTEPSLERREGMYDQILSAFIDRDMTLRELLNEVTLAEQINNPEAVDLSQLEGNSPLVARGRMGHAEVIKACRLLPLLSDEPGACEHLYFELHGMTREQALQPAAQPTQRDFKLAFHHSSTRDSALTQLKEGAPRNASLLRLVVRTALQNTTISTAVKEVLEAFGPLGAEALQTELQADSPHDLRLSGLCTGLSVFAAPIAPDLFRRLTTTDGPKPRRAISGRSPQ